MKADSLNPNRFVLDFQANAKLQSSLKNDPQASVKQAAQQFEGMLLQMMLKSMRDATPQDGVMDSDQTRFFTSIMDQQLAQNLSAEGKLGFAKLIEQQIGRNQASGSTDDVPLASLSELQAYLVRQQAVGMPAGVASAGAARIRSSPSAENAQQPRGSAASGSAGDFVNQVWSHAVDAAASLGVPPHFLVAHAALETGWGKGEIRLPDGSSAHNLFGIKAGGSWQGPSVEVQTTEYINGEAQSVKQRFRVYGSYSESFRDYANLLKSNARYSGVLGQQDGTQFARSLQQSGYATDPMYADKLSRIINGPTLRQALVG